jgi:fructose-1,6-bisphosphatase/inositol monophosphatase family enzyme
MRYKPGHVSRRRAAPQSMTVPDLDRVAGLIREVAEAEILPRFRRLEDHHSWEKRPGSVVTVADEAAEKRLEDALLGLVPEAVALGEEAAEADKSIFERLLDDQPVWVIDPLDGTRNFAAGKSAFAMIVAYVVAGETLAGWIHDPVQDRTVMAAAGKGARTGDGTALRIADSAPLDAITGVLGPRLTRHKPFSGRFRAISNSKSCGVDYARLAAGEIHFAYYRGLMPWDHAAGALLHSEAGGFNACLDGRPYRSCERGIGGLLMAPDKATWQAIADAIPDALAAAGAPLDVAGLPAQV